MELISKSLEQRPERTASLSSLRSKILMNSEIAEFILKNKLTEQQISKALSKFSEYLTEREKFNAESPYKPILEINDGYVDVSYQETDYLVKNRAQLDLAKRFTLLGLSPSFKKVSWQHDIYDQITNRDKGRMPAIRAIQAIINEPSSSKGIYLYGDFGVGKSYLLAGMINSLAGAGLTCQMIHYPTFISQPNFGASGQVDDVKKSEVLVLDDIGGEVNSAWARDNVLQVILQYRMDNNLLTFFTSNYSMKDLETRLAQTRDGVDTWAAKRVMERIKYLTMEIHLEGKNRRHD
ncbi:MAG: primosomal protein DnaI [Streptococcaceae bacterium]|jgi:primosomal protein DnaI|nr:primosomal protein DnaI [Streptococcaceae bacterium]